jgi:hypothetical protein
MMNRAWMLKWKWWFMAPLGIVGMAVFVFLGGTVVQLLWNWLMPSLFGLRQVTLWQAVGLLGLCRILFGGSGMMHGHRSRYRDRLREKWNFMTPEERERFRAVLRERGGLEPDASGRP